MNQPLPPNASQSRRNAHKAAFRKRETWMPRLAASMRANKQSALFSHVHMPQKMG